MSKSTETFGQLMKRVTFFIVTMVIFALVTYIIGRVFLMGYITEMTR